MGNRGNICGKDNRVTANRCTGICSSWGREEEDRRRMVTDGRSMDSRTTISRLGRKI